jgi:hypothetical protein
METRNTADATTPARGECVLCYVARMIDAHGCDTTLRWARRWRDLRLPQETGLEARFERRGGYCDCEIFLNGWDLRPDAQAADADGADEPARSSFPPTCRGVADNSSQPCGQWAPRARLGC